MTRRSPVKKQWRATAATAATTRASALPLQSARPNVCAWPTSILCARAARGAEGLNRRNTIFIPPPGCSGLPWPRAPMYNYPRRQHNPVLACTNTLDVSCSRPIHSPSQTSVGFGQKPRGVEAPRGCLGVSGGGLATRHQCTHHVRWLLQCCTPCRQGPHRRHHTPYGTFSPSRGATSTARGVRVLTSSQRMAA